MLRTNLTIRVQYISHLTYFTSLLKERSTKEKSTNCPFATKVLLSTEQKCIHINLLYITLHVVLTHRDSLETLTKKQIVLIYSRAYTILSLFALDYIYTMNCKMYPSLGSNIDFQLGSFLWHVNSPSCCTRFVFLQL